MIDLNVRALTELSLAFIDSLARHRGGILNVASVAAFLPGPGMAVYYASKAYVLSFSEALHRELADRRPGHCAVPGPVPTEFQARPGMQLNAAARALELSAERVAQNRLSTLSCAASASLSPARSPKACRENLTTDLRGQAPPVI